MNNLTLKDLMRHQAQVKEDMPALDLEPVKKLFTEKEHAQLPEIDASQVGRIRLLRTLRNKFGTSFKSIPAVKAAIDHYDNEVKYMQHYKKLLGARHGNNK